NHTTLQPFDLLIIINNVLTFQRWNVRTPHGFTPGVGVAFGSITSKLASVVTGGCPLRSTLNVNSQPPPIVKWTGTVYPPGLPAIGVASPNGSICACAGINGSTLTLALLMGTF